MAVQDSNVGTDIELPFKNALVICAFLAIAWYNVLELTVLIQTYFKRYVGFYYYSLLIATWGIFFHGLGMFLKFYHINDGLRGHDIVNTTITVIGWCAMVTGQSVVLYSRLHLIVQARWTRWILVGILANGSVLHTLAAVFTYLVNCTSTPERWAPIYSVIEKFQVSGFFVQEVMLSGIYIWKTTMLLRQEGPVFNSKKNARGNRGRKVLLHTLMMSIIIIALDMMLLGLEFAGLYDIQTSYKGAVYSVKLKMEFSILNQLMNLVRGNLGDTTTASSPQTGTTTTRTHKYDRRAGPHHSTVRGGGSELGHSAGAYARMDDLAPVKSIQLQSLKPTEVLKTTVTEVRSDKIEDEDDGGSGGGGVGTADGRRASAASSEVYIIEQDRKPSF